MASSHSTSCCESVPFRSSKCITWIRIRRGLSDGSRAWSGLTMGLGMECLAGLWDVKCICMCICIIYIYAYTDVQCILICIYIYIIPAELSLCKTSAFLAFGHVLLSPSRVRHHVYRSIMGEKVRVDGGWEDGDTGTGGSGVRNLYVLGLDIRTALSLMMCLKVMPVMHVTNEAAEM